MFCVAIQNEENIHMNQPKRIFIVGHSGAGKGVFAQAIAKKLGWQFLDADFALAPSIGRPLTEILGKQGEESFHQCLLDILSNQISKENIVVTTDDCIVCSDKCRQLLASEFTVHLKVSTPVQLERIAHNRPLLSIADYKAFLDQLHHERDALYDQVASFSISSDDNALEEHVSSVLKAIG
jgi:shikimate kinase